ncbi:hypothetical protein [Inquilinus sp. OTU3971]|uniref:hypothetical protein n=1 Tax=Inquilinus sp. OTU3971 TaxID=3043855 RepID=UPI00313BB4D4
MGDNLKYAAQKLGDFVDCLTLGPGRIAERLQSGFLSLSAVQAKDFEGTPFGTVYEDIQSISSNKPNAGRGTRHATLTAMSEDEARELARRIVKLRDDVDEHLAAREALPSRHRS